MSMLGNAGAPGKANLRLCTFADLRASRIVQTWTTLNRWIDEDGFPPGRILGRNRVWTESEVMGWVESRPTAKAPPRGNAKRLVALRNGGVE